MKERRHDIDWVRVIAMLGVFLLHCTRFFCTEYWHVKAAPSEQSELWAILRGLVLWVWLMPMFFLVAGFASRYALSRRTTGQYLIERAKRLLIPLYTVGMLVLIPPQAYLDGVTHGRVAGSFWQWLPGFYRGLPGQLFDAPQVADPIFLVPYTFSGHLWFLQLLFIISLFTLPLLLYLRTERGQRLIGALARWCVRPGGILLFAIPLAVVQVGLRWLPVTTDRTWADFIWYALFFVFGYIIAADARFAEGAKRLKWVGLALWLALFIGVGGFLTLALDFDTADGRGFSALYLLWRIASTLASWGAIVFILGLAASRLNFTNRFLAYSNEAVLPFYMFHQTVILVVGWYVLRWNIGVMIKFLAIAAISLPLTLLLYEVFVRRVGFMRFLFGMAPQKKKQ